MTSGTQWVLETPNIHQSSVKKEKRTPKKHLGGWERQFVEGLLFKLEGCATCDECLAK